MATMPTKAVEPVKAATAKGAAPPIATAATTPLPRASVSMGPPGAKPAARPAPKKSKAPVAIAASLVVVAAAGVGGYMAFGRSTEVATGPRADTARRETAGARSDSAARDTAAGTRDTSGRRPAGDTGGTRPPAGPDGTIQLAGAVPSGARTTLDGRPVSGPRISAAPGTYTLRIEAQGYRAFSQRVTVVPGPAITSVMVRMPQETAAESPPEGQPPPGGQPPAGVNCEAPLIFNNPTNRCYDTRPVPRATPIAQVPAACTAPPRAVTLMVRVTAAGQVERASVSGRSGCAEFDEAARALVLDWAFTPAMKDGQAINGWYIASVRPQPR